MSSPMISLSCRVGNSLPITLVTSKDSKPLSEPELCRGALKDKDEPLPLIGRVETGATSSAEIADGAIGTDRLTTLDGDAGLGDGDYKANESSGVFTWMRTSMLDIALELELLRHEGTRNECRCSKHDIWAVLRTTK